MPLEVLDLGGGKDGFPVSAWAAAKSKLSSNAESKLKFELVVVVVVLPAGIVPMASSNAFLPAAVSDASVCGSNTFSMEGGPTSISKGGDGENGMVGVVSAAFAVP